MFQHFLGNFRKPEDNFAGRLMVRSMNQGHEKLATWGRSYLKINKEDTVLDLGCGGGRNIEYFLTQGATVYGMDHSQTSVSMARERNKEAIKSGRCQILVGDVKRLPFKDESMTIVTAFETIYFWNEIEACFEEIYRVLNKGGHFLICNEVSSMKRRDVRLLAGKIAMEVYTPDDLTNMLTKVGLSCAYHLDRKEQLAFIATK